MKMRVRAVTNNWTRAELSQLREAHATAGFGVLSAKANAAVQKLREERGRIVHLECGHEFRIQFYGPEPTEFNCPYCLRVPTFEEQREAARAHRMEAERTLR